MQNHTQEALTKLLNHLEEMAETVQFALAGDAEALHEVISEYHGPYTRASKLAGEVAQAVQWDDDERVEAEYVRELEREEGRRGCGP